MTRHKMDGNENYGIFGVRKIFPKIEKQNTIILIRMNSLGIDPLFWELSLTQTEMIETSKCW